MKKLLNTLYVTTEGASLKKDGENVVVSVEGEERARVPFHMLTSLVLFGPILVTPALIGAAASAGMTLVFLSRIEEWVRSRRGSRGRSPATSSCAGRNIAPPRRRTRSSAPCFSARSPISARC